MTMGEWEEDRGVVGDAVLAARVRSTVERAVRDVGGVEEALSRAAYATLSAMEAGGMGGASAAKGMLVQGPGGVGKSALVEAMLAGAGAEVVRAHAAELYSAIEGETEDAVSSLFKRAILRAPSVLLIDGIEAIAARPKRQGEVQERRALLRFLACLDALPENSRVFVIGISGRGEALDHSLLRGGRLDIILSLTLPTRDARLGMLRVLSRDTPLDTERAHEILTTLADTTHGYGPSDLRLLLRVCLENALDRSRKFIDMSDVRMAISSLRPSILRDRPPLPVLPEWADMHGVDDVKETVRQVLVAALGDTSKWDALGISPPRGILLHGPTGVGKTTLAVGTSSEMCKSANFITAQATELIGSAVGSSEKAIANIFRQARACAPCILFLDQLDTLAPHRNADSSSERTFDRVLSQLLMELDGVKTSKGGGKVVVIAATSRPEAIDKAILRPGRLDLHVKMTLPDRGSRINILRATLGKNECCDEAMQTDDVLGKAADQTDGWSSADVVNLCREAAMAALREIFDGSKCGEGRVTQEHFWGALSRFSSQRSHLPEKSVK